MKVPNGADLTEYLAKGQTVYYAWMVYDGNILKNEYKVQKVTPKQVVIVEAMTDGRCNQEARRRTDEEIAEARGWTLDLHKVQTLLFLNERAYKEHKLEGLEKSVQDTVVSLAKLTTERDKLVAELEAMP